MSTSDPLIGKRLGDYLIEGILGTGGMARVYRGYDDNLDRYAAIKVIEPQLIASAEEDEYRERFLREARSIARLSHQRIVGVYQFNQVGNLYYIAMEYVEGRNLRDVLKGYLRQGRVMPTDELLNVLRDIADALDYAHKQNIIHRDVKPSNIIFTPDGKSVLTDFGLALNSVEGTIGNTFGSVHYIAPEQAISSAQSVPASDQYSLGIVAYEMLTGRVPFDDASAMSVALKHISDPPPPPTELNPNIPAEVEQVLLKALSKDVSRRYESCMAFVRAIEMAFEMSNRADVEPPKELIAPGTADTPVMPPRADSASVNTKVLGDSIMVRASQSIPQNIRKNPPLGFAILLVIVVVAIAGGFFYMTTAANNQIATETSIAMANQSSTDSAQTAIAVAIQRTSDAVTATAVFEAGNETSTAIAIAAMATDTPEPSDTPTATDTDTPAPTDTPTATDTDTPEPTDTPTATDTDTPEPTDTPTATNTPTATDTDTPAPTNTPTATNTATNTPVPTRTPTPALEFVPDVDSSQVLLRYDGRMLVIGNRDSVNRIDMSDLVFVLFQTDENGASVEAARFDVSRATFAQQSRSTTPNRCFELLDRAVFRSLPPDSDNPMAQGFCLGTPFWETTVDPFWISEDRNAYFEVRLGPVDVLTTCPVNPPLTRVELRCAVDLNALP